MSEEKKPAKKQEDVEEARLPVTIISQHGSSVLVEYMQFDNIHRTTIPASEVVNGKAGEHLLSTLGIPYGLPWETALPEMNVTPAMLAAELRRQNIWTAEDALANQQAVLGAIRAVYGFELSTVLQIASNYSKKGR